MDISCQPPAIPSSACCLTLQMTHVCMHCIYINYNRMGKRKLRFDVRKNYERKRQQVSLAEEVNAVQSVICPLLAATINACDVNTLQI